MSTELLYTSAPRGLRHGSRGFCTVLTTAGMPINVIARLESISSYRHLFAPDSGRAAENPVSFCHQRLNLAGQIVSVISRVSAYGTDYSGRTNKIAHHVLIDSDEMPAAGPAWLIRQRAVLRSEWLGQCETPPAGPTIPRGDQPPRICAEWKSVAGDAGWGGVVAESISSGGAEPLWVIYPLQHQFRLLELMDESISLLPAPQRWRATFSTYAANIPPDVQCKVRFVPLGTEEAKFATASGKAIDLTKHQSITTASQWVERARGLARPEIRITSSGGSFSAVQERDDVPYVASEWSSAGEIADEPPPSPEPPALPPEWSRGKSNRRALWISAACVLVVSGIAMTWITARLMAGLPVMPGAKPSPGPVMPEDIVQPLDETPAPEIVVALPIKTLELTLHYDKKQILQWASADPQTQTPLPAPVLLRGFARIHSGTMDASGDQGPDQNGNLEKVQGGAKLVSWGGEAISLGQQQEIQIQTASLNSGTQTMSVETIPQVPESLGSTRLFWNRETDDLVAIAEFDFSDEALTMTTQRDAYRTYAIQLAEVSKLVDSIEKESEQLPNLMKDAIAGMIRGMFPGQSGSRIESMIRRGTPDDVAGEVDSLRLSLESKVETMAKPLNKAEQVALVKVIGRCGELAQSAQRLQSAFSVLKQGHRQELLELQFLKSPTAVLRRVPIQIHFSW